MLKLVSRLSVFLLSAVLLFTASAAVAAPNLQTGTLSLGSYGPQVETLQRELKQLGYYDGNVTGIFDTDTESAVRDLQSFLGVRIDGKFGQETLGAYLDAIHAGRLNLMTDNTSTGSRLNGCVIGVDPGHQEIEDLGLEPVSPGSERTKARMSKGATGVKTGVPEYRINLQIALKLKTLLESEGAQVVMTRTDHNVSLSNLERSTMMNEAGVDFWIRLHCDASSSQDVSGARALIPSRAITPLIYRKSLVLAKTIMAEYTVATGTNPLPIRSLINQTGFNWSETPVIAIEMGYLSNSSDDLRLNRDSYQAACATGIFKGILHYYEYEQTS